jgi:hypothetical protein
MASALGDKAEAGEGALCALANYKTRKPNAQRCHLFPN